MILLDTEINVAWHEGKDLVLYNFLPDKPKYYEGEKIYATGKYLDLYFLYFMLYGSLPLTTSKLSDDIIFKKFENLKPGLEKDINLVHGEYSIPRIEALKKIYDKLITDAKAHNIVELFEAYMNSAKYYGRIAPITIVIERNELEQLFLQEFTGKENYTEQDLARLEAEVNHILNTRGYIKTKFNKRGAGMKNPLEWLLIETMRDFIYKATYAVHRMASPYGGYAYTEGNNIFCNFDTVPHDKAEALELALSDIINACGKNIDHKIRVTIEKAGT